MIKPKIKYLNNSTFKECLDNNEFYQVLINENINYLVEIQDIEFNECKFENIDRAVRH